jgi:hypothetical protein
LPGRDRGRAIGDRGAAAATAAAPLHGRGAQARQPQRGGQAGGFAAVVAVRGEAVDVAWIQARVGAGAQHGLQRQLELGIGRLAVLVVVRLPDADDRDTALQCALGHRWDRIRQ